MSGAEDGAGRERRREARIASANLVNYHELSSIELLPSRQRIYSALGTARTEDISATGCKLICSEALPVGAKLEFDLQVGDHILPFQGRVVRAQERAPAEWELGVDFTDIGELAQDGLRLYLSFKEEDEPAS